MNYFIAWFCFAVVLIPSVTPIPGSNCPAQDNSMAFASSSCSFCWYMAVGGLSRVTLLNNQPESPCKLALF